MPESLLKSQLDALELPDATGDRRRRRTAGSEIVDAIVLALRRA
jgi:hypothetical protein